MSHSNVSKEMSHTDVNASGKAYHEHGDNKDKKEAHVGPESDKHHHPEPKEHIPHGHDNQYRKDLKGSAGSGSSEPGDHKKDHK